MVQPGEHGQHDTLVLGSTTQDPLLPGPGPTTHDTLVLGAPQPGTPYAPPAMPAAWQQPAWAAWSSGPPYLPTERHIVVRRNNAAVVGATLGSVALFLAVLPVIGIVAWLLAPIALLTSVIGLAVGVRSKVGRFGAVWGLGTSTAALVVCFMWVALVLAL